MGSPFDLMQQSMMDVITRQFGYPARWIDGEGIDMGTGTVLLKIPSKKSSVEEKAYMYDYPTIEYREGIFVGLKEAADNTRYTQHVNVDGNWFVVRNVKKIYDGKTYVALLEEDVSYAPPVYLSVNGTDLYVNGMPVILSCFGPTES